MAKISEHKVTPFIITDFETGGKDPGKHALTEIGMLAIRGDTLEEIGRYESLIAPYDGYEYDPEAEAKTGLSRAFLAKHGKPIDVVRLETIEFLKKANVHNSTTGHKPVIVGHNPLYEMRCFQQLFKGMDEELNKLLHGSLDIYGHFIIAHVDTILLAKMMYGGNNRVKHFGLEDVMTRAAIALNDGHRAMNDVIPTREYFVMNVKLLRATEGGVVDQSATTKSFRDGFKYEF